MVELGPPYPAIGNVILEMIAPPQSADIWDVAVWGTDSWSGAAVWDVAVWGVATWLDNDWLDVTPESMHVKYSWGADTGALGVLSMTVAGHLIINTYDPLRILDPSNPNSPVVGTLRPGTPLQLRFAGPTEGRTVKVAAIDTINYSINTQRGLITAIDGVSKLAAIKLPAGLTGMPPQLLEAANWVLEKAGITSMDAAIVAAGGNPIIGAPIAEEASAWDWLNTLGLDVRYGVSLIPLESIGTDLVRERVLFTRYTVPTDLGLAIGGAGIPLDDVDVEKSREGLYSRIIAYDTGAPSTPVLASDLNAEDDYGIAVFERTRPVPNAASWVSNVLADRKDASAQYILGTLRPRVEEEIVALLDTFHLCVAHLNIALRDDANGMLSPAIIESVNVIGAQFEAHTQAGWSARLITYVP